MISGAEIGPEPGLWFSMALCSDRMSFSVGTLTSAIFHDRIKATSSDSSGDGRSQERRACKMTILRVSKRSRLRSAACPVLMGAGWPLPFARPSLNCSLLPNHLFVSKSHGVLEHFSTGRSWLYRISHLGDRKSTRLNSSHSQISYAVFCLK